jgi:hypothetical protein
MFVTPAEAIRLSMKMGLAMAQAQMVIGLRMMGWAGLWRTTPSENMRMITEKVAAVQAAGLAAATAAARGKAPAAVAEAALRPVARKVADNARRLGRRGPKLPG